MVATQKGLARLLPALVVSMMSLAVAADAPHTLELNGLVSHAEEGLLLGNGDLSCSVYQDGDDIVFRFGKGDVWDRRVDHSRSPMPPITHDEFVRGLLDEGWTCNAYDGNGTKATKGSRNEARMKAFCTGAGASMRDWPYPCPKPTGELRMRLPVDLPGPMRLSQSVHIEEGLLRIVCEWRNAVRLGVEGVIDPETNVFSLKWKVLGWGADTKPVESRAPVSFRLVRFADPDPLAFACGNGWETYAKRWGHGQATPLPAPKAFKTGSGRYAVQQDFPAEKTFPNGFSCRMTMGTQGNGHLSACGGAGRTTSRDAMVVFRPEKGELSGEVMVTVTTTRDGTLDAPALRRHADYVARARSAAAADWARSSLSVPGDPFLERIWYATYHARRCILRGGTVPPGLFFPSSLSDFSYWHGDYHSNYNYQSIYWGGYAANRLSEQLAGIDCSDFFAEIGRLRAAKYYGMRGTVIPLEGFPIKVDEDYSTGIPLGRMVYMTGWLAVPYWEHYLYTLDRDFLARRGYPVLKDIALFFLDFLKKAPSKDLPPDLNDGLYHAFPSIEEETPIRSLKDVTDRTEVIAFVRYGLYAAIRASEELNVDADLRALWRDRLDNLAATPRNLTGYARHCFFANSPEFGYSTPVPKPPAAWKGEPKKFRPGWYFGHSIRSRLRCLRTNEFVPDRDFDEYRRSLEYWAHPNGLVWGMCLELYGRCGAWTETLSCVAPLQEMMLQSWDGAIRLFPCWPKDKDVSFGKFRAQGAFLVSSEWKGGRIGKTEIESEKGAVCHLHGTWRVKTADGRNVATTPDEFGHMSFPTAAGERYLLEETGR